MQITKKTKIVATVGPVSENEEMLEKMTEAGMNIVRLNFSHSDMEGHTKRLEMIRNVEKKTGKTLGVLQDLGGPKIRIGEFSTEKITLKEGEIFTFTTAEMVGNEKIVYVNYKNLPVEVKPGGEILVEDGKKRLEVISAEGNEVKTRVIVGGEITGRRGVNLPGAYLSVSSITEKDRKDIEFGIKNKVDFTALSFVRKGDDIKELREILKSAGSESKIIAKIETREAVENLDEILNLSDGAMVARGDLAIEIGLENVPIIQKTIIKKCNLLGKPVITATQVLESMIESPVPTRAEVSDAANAILDGTDAVMLSAETAAGKYPAEAVDMLRKVAERTEKDYNHRRMHFRIINHEGVKDPLSGSVINSANDSSAKLIVAFTESGRTARFISRWKPRQPIVCFTPNEDCLGQIMLSFGCYGVPIKRYDKFEEALHYAENFLVESGLAEKGDKIVIAAGAPFDEEIAVNSLLVKTL